MKKRRVLTYSVSFMMVGMFLLFGCQKKSQIVPLGPSSAATMTPTISTFQIQSPTPVLTDTVVQTVTPTNTPTYVSTSTTTSTLTSTATHTPTDTVTPIPTNTQTATSTATFTPWIVEGTAANFNDEALNCPIPVLVEFYATWCPHCQDMAPAIIQFSIDQTGKCKVVKVNVDLEPGLVATYGVSGLPTCIFFVSGSEKTRFSGSYSTTVENVNLLTSYFDAL